MSDRTNAHPTRHNGGVAATARKRLSPRQKWVIALGLVTLGLGLGNLGRATMALWYSARLPDLPLTVSWGYLAAMGGLWGLAFVVCAVGLALFRPWGRWATLAAVTLHQAHVWVNHLLLDASDYARQTRPRDLVVTLFLLALFWSVLNLPRVRSGFDQSKPNSESVR